MKPARKAWLVALMIMIVTAMFALSACAQDESETPGPSGGGSYYLSVYEGGSWKTYSSDSEVPAANKFASSGDVYTLTVALEQGATVKIARVGATAMYGYSALFTARTELTEGANDAMVVAQKGTFKFTFDPSDNTLSYTFTAEQQQPPVEGEKTVMLVEIDDSNFALTYPATKQLTATVTYDDFTEGHAVTWESSDTDVATVDSDGIVHSVSAGTAQIVAKAGGEESDPVTVTVNGTVTVTLDKTVLAVEEHAQATATSAGGATVSAGTWFSTDATVATIDATSGEITAVAPGTTTIRVSYRANPSATLDFATCELTVNVPLTGITLAGTLSVTVDGTQDLTVGFVPANASNKDYTYVVTQDGDYISVTQNNEVLTVEGLAIGTATITVTSDEGNFTQTCTVSVVEAGTETANEISPQTLNLNRSTTGTLSISGTGIASVAWKSGTTTVATVAADAADSTQATVTAVAFGTATITAEVTFVSGEKVTKTRDVVVSPDQMWVYGDVVNDGWNATDTYDEAAAIGYGLTKTSATVFEGTVHLPADKDFRLAHDNFDWKGVRWEHISSVASEKQNAVQGGNDQNSGYNVRVTKAGEYKVTADFGGAKPVLKIQVVSIDVVSVAVAADKSTLTSNGTDTVAVITATINPTDATYEESDIKWTLTNENLVTKVASNGNKTLTVTVKGDLEEGGTVKVTFTVKEQTASVDITIVAAGAAITPVSSIAFEQTSYAFNVNNNGAFNGTATVKAKVNEDATNQGVTYSTSDAGVSVDASTGVITATKVGTFTITATAAGDSSKTTTVDVTFYSDMFYITGAVNSWGDTGTNTTTVGTKFENYTFTPNATFTEFTLQVAITSANSTFQIMFIGAGSTWDYAITGSNAKLTGLTNSGANIVFGSAGLWTVTIKLSGTQAEVIGVNNGSVPTYTATLKKGNADVVTSENSELNNNRYSMGLVATFEAAEYTIAITGVTTTTITSIVGGTADDTTYFTLADNKLTCVTPGKYRLDILSDSNGNAVVTITALTADGPVVTTAYSVAISGDTNGWTPTAVEGQVIYFDAESGQYTAYFALELTAYKGFGFIVTGENDYKKEIWMADATLSNEAGKVQFNDNAGWLTKSISGNWANIQSDTTGTLYCKMIFTAAGIVSVDTSTTSLAPSNT